MKLALNFLMKISLFFKSINSFSKTYIPSSTLIKQLRETTGSPIAECKSALQQFEGDMVQAKELLKKKGFAQAAKRLSKATQEGIIGVYMEKDRKKALIAEV